MTLFRFSSSTVDDSEVGRLRRTLRRSVYVSGDMAMPGISYTRYMPLWFIHTGRSTLVCHSCQCANIICIFNSSSYSNHYCFKSYIIPLAILVNRLVIFGRYCMIRLLQLNALSICLALNRLNKFNNIFHQFSKSCRSVSLATVILSQMPKFPYDRG